MFEIPCGSGASPPDARASFDPIGRIAQAPSDASMRYSLSPDGRRLASRTSGRDTGAMDCACARPPGTAVVGNDQAIDRGRRQGGGIRIRIRAERAF
jgi:hypothetical protein